MEALIEELQVTRTELAKKIHIEKSTLSGFINGDHLPCSANWALMARSLKRDVFGLWVWASDGEKSMEECCQKMKDFVITDCEQKTEDGKKGLSE